MKGGDAPHLSIWIGNGIFVQLSQDSKKHLAFDQGCCCALGLRHFFVATNYCCCIRNPSPNGSFVFRNLLISAKFQRTSQMNSIFVPPKTIFKKKQKTRSWWIPNSILRRLGSQVTPHVWSQQFLTKLYEQNTWKTKKTSTNSSCVRCVWVLKFMTVGPRIKSRRLRWCF